MKNTNTFLRINKTKTYARVGRTRKVTSLRNRGGSRSPPRGWESDINAQAKKKSDFIFDVFFHIAGMRNVNI